MSVAYGYCPVCGGLGMSRERRLNGNDRCENGHMYPSSLAVVNPLLPVAPEHTAGTERAAIVAWLRECALDPETTGAEMRLLQAHANLIERGEHRREEKA